MTVDPSSTSMGYVRPKYKEDIEILRGRLKKGRFLLQIVKDIQWSAGLPTSYAAGMPTKI